MWTSLLGYLWWLSGSHIGCMMLDAHWQFQIIQRPSMDTLIAFFHDGISRSSDTLLRYEKKVLHQYWM